MLESVRFSIGFFTLLLSTVRIRPPPAACIRGTASLTLRTTLISVNWKAVLHSSSPSAVK